MIKVQVKETGAIEVLKAVDANGTDFTADMIGNHGGFCAEQFARIEGTDVYEASQVTYDWWAKVLSDNEALEGRLAILREAYGSDAVYDAVASAGSNELEDHAAAVNAVLDEVFGAE